ncbi:amyloid-beta A4 precursor protein-binding family A member 1 [Boleophthalmus pectinirostris]|uniref:amyloid-beta A4 precursor protein-binding family A member 1 n=1 Tax=Boleophthalmus pectinirostris TaxID=150288 RepID=UPI000A1C703D|nr:amyloid-beta A4 precursor protein-binding family A member 1 [Boleophthalmus pectinirostris]
MEEKEAPTPPDTQRTHTHRRTEAPYEMEAEPRPPARVGTTRYRRQGDTEARLRAQQHRQQRRQQREAQQEQRNQEDERERDDSALARSASTESGFHTHTDRAEGDDSLVQSTEPEDEIPRASASALPQDPSAEYSKVLGCSDSEELRDETYCEPYEIYSPSEHVYEEICEAAGFSNHLPQRRANFTLEAQSDSGDYQHAVGSRLHHYDERSDGESDSPEKEAEFAPYPRADSGDLEEDGDSITVELRISLSSQSLNCAKELPSNEENVVSSEIPPDQSSVPAEVHKVTPVMRSLQEKKDAISLAIKDIREAIEEVKTRTVRSPYTPDEPKEPVWVMRQDLSPTADCELQQPLEGDSPRSGSPSPSGAEGSSSQLLPDESLQTPSPREAGRSRVSFPTYVEVPGPCDPEDLIDGIIFAANYLGSTQLLSDKTPSKNVRMMQAQEAVSRIKAAQKQAQNKKKATEDEAHMTEVDLFISTQRIKVLNADSQDTMMDHPLRTISYIADIGNIVVLMARRRMPQSESEENAEEDSKRQYKMICHVFESEDAQLIAQSIGQAFSVAYQEFLRANGINPEDLSQKEYSDLLNTQDMYNDDLVHFSKSENCKDVIVEKAKGEILGVVIVESGWGSILPTVIVANMMHAGPAERSGRLNIGDQIMSINGTSLVGLPLSTCQSIIKGLKNQSRVKLNIVRCPPVTTVLIRRPDLRYQLGFSVQNGIICSLMRGGIAERGGVRVGHRIIEINSQSVVATTHEKIVHILSNAVGEIHMKTMPAAMYRLLTAQEQPIYI